MKRLEEENTFLKEKIILPPLDMSPLNVIRQCSFLAKMLSLKLEFDIGFMYTKLKVMRRETHF